MSGGLKDSGPGPEQKSLFKDADQRAGHRQRLKDRFVAGGPEALPDYELLELVLFNAIPRRDTKPVAKRLIERFGSFAEVVNAPPERLKEVKGVGDAAIVAAEARACRRLAPDAGRHHAAPGAGVLDRRARLLPRGHGLRGARAVPHPLSRQEEPADRRRGAAARAPSITRRSMCARSSSARWSSRPAPSSWCTTTPRATPRPRAPTST